MDLRAAELAAARLYRTREFFLHALVLAALTAAATVAAAALAHPAAFPLGVLAAAEGLVVMSAHYARRDLLQKLALDPYTANIPAVDQYRERILAQPARDRLAASITSLVANAELPGAFSLPDRIALVEDQLRMLARALATPEVPIQARSLVALLRLVTHGVESPLFNPGVPVEQLQATLLRIRFDIGKKTGE